MNINYICKELQLSGEVLYYEALTSGNINTTYHVCCNNGTTDSHYLLQRINKNVFKDPIAVMDNILKVTEYVSSNHKNSSLSVLSFNKTKEGNPYFIDELGNFWRSRQFFESVAYDKTDDLYIIKEAGSAFGEFQYMLDGFDASSLVESIPDFHNTKKRLQNLERAYNLTTKQRKENCLEEIHYILEYKDIASTLTNMLENNELPLRVTHNDTKCNNVIFHKDTLKALAVIDLDTIMPGLTAYDFGDGARSISSTTLEDETDLSKVKFDLDKFEAFAKGYLSKLHTILTENEVKTLGLSCFILTLELASRFLEDYLNGDIYFKITSKEHNLIRTRCQIALCKDIWTKLDKINEIINKYSK